MDPEIKRALANIKRRAREIEAKYGKSEDDGPLFGRRHERKRLVEQTFFDDIIDEEFQD